MNNDKPNTLGELIRLCRLEKKVNLKEVALKTGIRVKDLAAFEDNSKIPKIEDLIVVADAVGHVLHIAFLEPHEKTFIVSPQEEKLLVALRKRDLPLIAMMITDITMKLFNAVYPDGEKGGQVE